MKATFDLQHVEHIVTETVEIDLPAYRWDCYDVAAGVSHDTYLKIISKNEWLRIDKRTDHSALHPVDHWSITYERDYHLRLEPKMITGEGRYCDPGHFDKAMSEAINFLRKQ